MNRTRQSDTLLENRITLSTEDLMDVLSCGICTARKIGEAAGAKIVIGKRVLWSVDKIKAYLDSIAE